MGELLYKSCVELSFWYLSTCVNLYFNYKGGTLHTFCGEIMLYVAFNC